MKRFLLLFAILLAMSGSASAQVYYKCVGNKVAVRSTPNAKSRLVEGLFYAEGICCVCGNDDHEFSCYHPVYLKKGEIVSSRGETRNGFIMVYDVWQNWRSGWVPAKYLVRAQKCTRCKGKGYTKLCPECYGEGCADCYGAGNNGCSGCGSTGYR